MADKANILFLYHPVDQPFYKALSLQLAVFRTKLGELRQLQPPEDAPTPADLALLDDSPVVVALLSPDSLAGLALSAFGDELQQRNAAGTVSIIPILARDCPVEVTFFATLLEENPTAIGQVQGQETAFKKTAIAIYAAAQQQLPLLGRTQLRRLLQNSLCYLNFSSQINALKEYRRQTNYLFNPINIFLVKGTIRCGHRLLIRNFLQRYQACDTIYYLDFDEYYPNEHSIWPLVRDALHYKEVLGSSTDPVAITGQMIKELAHQPLVLHFDNVHVLGDQGARVINSFWQQLRENLKPHEDKLAHKFFLFLADKSLPEGAPIPDDPEEDGLFHLDDFGAGLPDMYHKKIVVLLPPIHPLEATNLQDWIDELEEHNELIPVLKIVKDKKQEVFQNGTSKLYLLEAARRIAQTAGFSPPEDHNLIKEL